ncbi:MAG: isopeptide-forming domain-containing fimbrial protein [Oscillospiraceae bacterium]|nr:isopeptide-forming domain-containing fimbrial protein [Oscillospiraceae bacterium]MCI9547782.1 isopeptide-forming domain-containing fimbrial protein [Oscillospiraceae bacterium]
MKHLKKLASVLLALVMVLALMAPAFAATEGGAADLNLTVNKHDYYVLPIFTGTPVNAESSEAFAEGSLKWAGPFKDAADMQKAFVNALIGVCDGGDGYAPNPTVKTALEAMIAASNYEENEVAKQLAALGSAVDSDPINAAIAEAIYNTVPQNALAAYEQKAGETEAYPAGYYLLHDLSNDAGQKDRLLRHVKDESVNPKTTGNNTLNKEVQSSTDDSWNHTGAYEPGDQIPFRIEAPIPDNFSNTNLTTYVMTFTDKQDEGLALPDGVTVNVYRPIKEGAATAGAVHTDSKGNEYEAIAGFEDPLVAGTDYSFTTNEAENSFTVNFSDMKGAAAKTKDLQPGDLIVITYTATLKEGADGYSYQNHVTLNSTDCEEQKDEDTVYNFKFEVVKVDGENDNAELPGAQFTLYRKPNSKDDDGDLVKVLKEPAADGSVYMPKSEYDAAEKKPEVYDGDWVFVDTLGDDEETAKFGFDHLIDGSYMLVEDKAPVVGGKTYNKIPPKYYVIKANYTPNNTMGQKLESVDLYETEDSTFNTAGKTPISIENGVTFTVGGKVQNFSGVLLPETGGIGTTIFYIVGGVLVVGAVVLLITKRRASADDE